MFFISQFLNFALIPLTLGSFVVLLFQITHTSDSFDICQDFARKMILAGQAYMDDTDQEKMQVLTLPTFFIPVPCCHLRVLLFCLRVVGCSQ